VTLNVPHLETTMGSRSCRSVTSNRCSYNRETDRNIQWTIAT